MKISEIMIMKKEPVPKPCKETFALTISHSELHKLQYSMTSGMIVKSGFHVFTTHRK